VVGVCAGVKWSGLAETRKGRLWGGAGNARGGRRNGAVRSDRNAEKALFRGPRPLAWPGLHRDGYRAQPIRQGRPDGWRSGGPDGSRCHTLSRIVPGTGVRVTVDELLAEARAGLVRLEPKQAFDACEGGDALVDVRSDSQRARDGVIPDAAVVPRNVLEWRLDPSSPHRDPELARHDRRVILICDQGYQSSLAAANLKRFGLDATDVVGGFQAWRAEALPVEAATDPSEGL
jgi:rhodanese-related sulfurtransferase